MNVGITGLGNGTISVFLAKFIHNLTKFYSLKPFSWYFLSRQFVIFSWLFYTKFMSKKYIEMNNSSQEVINNYFVLMNLIFWKTISNIKKKGGKQNIHVNIFFILFYCFTSIPPLKFDKSILTSWMKFYLVYFHFNYENKM